ncbi:MAG: hypothetical protein OEO82_11120 [Gammaproteobacteria bacterium]|nr:hypothetical protein [Gammaproteobacteria bacterium]
MTESIDAPEKGARLQAGHWTLIRDVGVLQIKLLVDGFRDLVLLPASLLAGMASLVQSDKGKPGPQFYRLLALGRQSDHWINLFGALKNSPEHYAGDSKFGSADFDDVVARVETFIVDEYQRGGVTRQAKERLDRALAAMQRGRKTP